MFRLKKHGSYIFMWLPLLYLSACSIGTNLPTSDSSPIPLTSGPIPTITGERSFATPGILLKEPMNIPSEEIVMSPTVTLSTITPQTSFFTPGMAQLALIAADWPLPQPMSIPVNLYVLSPDDLGLIPLLGTENPYIVDLAWSPDGRKIAFAGVLESPGTQQLYLINPDGTGLEQLTNLESDVLDVAWGPDGKKMAFVVWPGDISILNLERHEVETLTVGNKPDWSYIRDEIVFVKPERDLNFANNIYIIHPDGKGLHRLTEEENSIIDSPKWSPDGEQIAYRIADEGKTYSGIVVMNSNGSSQERLELGDEIHTISFFSWLPNGKGLLFANGDSGKLYIFNMEKHTVISLLELPIKSYFYGEWQPVNIQP